MRDPVSHRERRVVELVAPERWPPPPKEWLAVTRRQWVDFGASELAGLVQSAQMPDLEYLFELRDRRERYLRATRGGNAIAKGSKQQEVASPLLKLLPGLNREIRALSTLFGMTPAALKRLTGNPGATDPGKPTLAELLEAIDAEDLEVEDPRRLVVIGGTG